MPMERCWRLRKPYRKRRIFRWPCGARVWFYYATSRITRAPGRYWKSWLSCSRRARNEVEVEKAIREMPAPEGKPRPQATAAAPSGQQIVGRISIDPKLKGNVDSQATLFIIARGRRRQRPSTGRQEDRSSGFSALLLPRARKRNDAGYAFHRPCHDYGPLGQRW